MDEPNFDLILKTALKNQKKRKNKIILEAKLKEALEEKELVKQAIKSIPAPDDKSSKTENFEGYFSLTFTKLNLEQTIRKLRHQILLLGTNST